MITRRDQLIAFLVLLGVTALIVLMMWLPYLKLLALGAILAVLFYPVYLRLAERLASETAAAWLTIIIIIFILAVPLYLFGSALFGELVNLYNSVRSGNIAINHSQVIQHLPSPIRDYVENLFSNLSQHLSGWAGSLFSSLTRLASNVGTFVFSFFLVVLSIYYLLKDGKRLKVFVNSVLPLSESHENLLMNRLSHAVEGVVKGMFLVALLQGLVALVGFLIFGVPQPILWASFTVLAALVPTVGTSLSLIPAVLYLLITGHTGAGVGMAIWAALAVGTIDNIVSPKLVGSRVSIHPLLSLFGIIGGLQLFGFIGFLLGPIIMAVFKALLDIYRTEFRFKP